MAVSTVRLGATDLETLSLELCSQLVSADAFLMHMASLPGVKVIAKKSWALTDDFEAYFMYRGRLFVINTPFVKISMSLIGPPADEDVFRELESHAQSYGWRDSLLGFVSLIKFFSYPSNPPSELLKQHESGNGV